MSSSPTNLKQIAIELNHNASLFYENLILGQQAYIALLYYILFIAISQNAKRCAQLIKELPRERLLYAYATKVSGDLIWLSDTCGINQKIRNSYALLGFSYRKYGFDGTYSAFKSSVFEDILTFLALPISNYTHLLETYAWTKYHTKVSYKTTMKNKFAENDIEYTATTSFQGKQYSSVGFGKKGAIEHLAEMICEDSMSREDLTLIANSQGYCQIQPTAFHFASDNYEEKNPNMRSFCELYGFDFLFNRFALLTRSQMGGSIWNNLGIVPGSLCDVKPSLITRCLSNLGRELIALQILKNLVDSNGILLPSLSTLDITTMNIGPYEVHDQLIKITHAEKYAELLFEEIHPPITISVLSKISWPEW